MTIGPLRIKSWGGETFPRSIWRSRGYAISWVTQRRIISLELHTERLR